MAVRLYKCPRCGRTAWLPEGSYYCKVCGKDVVMERDREGEFKRLDKIMKSRGFSEGWDSGLVAWWFYDDSVEIQVDGWLEIKLKKGE